MHSLCTFIDAAQKDAVQERAQAPKGMISSIAVPIHRFRRRSSLCPQIVPKLSDRAIAPLPEPLHGEPLLLRQVPPSPSSKRSIILRSFSLSNPSAK
jgi:hypothetical protein